MAWLLALWLIWPSGLWADRGEIGLDQILVNNTVTNFGNGFYRAFANLWQAPAGVDTYHLVIREKPFRQRQSQMIVEVDGKPLLQFWLTWRLSDLDELALQAVRSVRSKMTLERQQGEVAEEDLAGSGW